MKSKFTTEKDPTINLESQTWWDKDKENHGRMKPTLIGFQKLVYIIVDVHLHMKEYLQNGKKVHQRPGIREKLKAIRNKRKIPEDGVDLTIKTSETPEIE